MQSYHHSYEVIKMHELEILRRLVYEANVQTNVLAKFCQCSPSAMANYIKGINLPSGSRLIAIKQGLRKYKEMVNQIIGEI